MRGTSSKEYNIWSMHGPEFLSITRLHYHRKSGAKVDGWCCTHLISVLWHRTPILTQLLTQVDWNPPEVIRIVICV